MLFTAAVILCLLVLLITNTLRPTLAFTLAVGVLYVSGEISQANILANITNTSVLTLISLMLASLALEKSVLLPWLSSKVFRPSYFVTLLRLGITTMVSSAFLNNTAVVATLMGGVQRNQEHPASRLLMPLSFFAILGGTLTLIGTSTNLVVDALLKAQHLPGLAFGDFFLVGLVLCIVVGSLVALMALRLPKGKIQTELSNPYFLDAEVQVGSKLVGKTVLQNGLRAMDGLFLVEIVRGEQLISPVNPQCVIWENDKLIFSGDVSQVAQLQQLDGVEVFADSNQLLSSNLQEVIVSPTSVLIGKTLKQTDFRSRFDAAVVAINRQGERLSGKLGEQAITAGDKLMLAVGPDFHKRQNLTRNFFLLSDIQLQSPLTSGQNWLAIGGFITAIALSIFTPVKLLDAVVAYVVLMSVTKIIDGTTLRRRFPFDLWLILLCALSIAQAFQFSGLATWLSSHLYQWLGGQSPFVALALLFVATVVLTETITNSAAAAIMLPIGLSLAEAYQVSSMTFVMAVAYGASACFLSPYGYQTNLMVMNAGGYRFGDFFKTGWPLSLVYIISSLIALMLVFPF